MVLEGDIGVFLARLFGKPRLGEFSVEKRVVDTLVVIPQENIALGHTGDVNAGGGDQGEGLNARGRPNRDFQRQPAAQRIADQMNLVLAERVEKIEIEIGEVAHPVEPVRRVRPAPSRMARHVNRIVLGQPVHIGHPALRAAGAVQEDERRPGAALKELYFAARNCHSFGGMRRHRVRFLP